MDRYVSFFESSKNFRIFSKIQVFSKKILSDLSDRKLVHSGPQGRKLGPFRGPKLIICGPQGRYILLSARN